MTISRSPRTVHHQFDFGNWYLVYRPFFRVMSYQETVLLCFLINQQQRWSPDDPDGWFFCKVQTIENEIAMPKRTQADCLNDLQCRKLIRVEKRGVPAKRWIQVRYNMIAKAVNNLA